jgi:pre-mRNA-splicing factor CWC22
MSLLFVKKNENKYIINKLSSNIKLMIADPEREYSNKKRSRDRSEGKENIPKSATTSLLPSKGGVYIPPFQMAKMYEEIRQTNDKQSMDYQKMMWEMLRKSINGIINKVNITNIHNIIYEILNENLLRGKGLLSRAIIKAQMASPNFTHVYAALVAVINTKLPDIGELILKRYILSFQKAYKRNNKIVCVASTRMLAQLLNQEVNNETLAYEVLFLFLENPTEDSVEMA